MGRPERIVVYASTLWEAREIRTDFESVRKEEDLADVRITYAKVPHDGFWRAVGTTPPVVYQVHGPRNSDWKAVHVGSRPSLDRILEILSVFPTHRDIVRGLAQALAQLEEGRKNPPRSVEEAVQRMLARRSARPKDG